MTWCPPTLMTVGSFHLIRRRDSCRKLKSCDFKQGKRKDRRRGLPDLLDIE